MPVLESGTYTNFGSTPKIVRVGQGLTTARNNKNVRIEVEDLPGNSSEMTFDGTLIYNELRGAIKCVHSDISKRNLMKNDIYPILKASGYPFEPLSFDDVPIKRNKEETTFFLRILC